MRLRVACIAAAALAACSFATIDASAAPLAKRWEWFERIGVVRAGLIGEVAGGWSRDFAGALVGPSFELGYRLRPWLLVGGAVGPRVGTLGSDCHYGGCLESGAALSSWAEVQAGPRNVVTPWARVSTGFYTPAAFVGGDVGLDLRLGPVALGGWFGGRLVSAKDYRGGSVGLRLMFEFGEL